MKVIFSIDAETIGLYGEPFAFGYVIWDLEGKELESGYLACPFEQAIGMDESRLWIEKNVIPYLPQEYVYENPKTLCEAIFSLLKRVKEQYKHLIILGDCHFPVETNLLTKAIQMNESERQFFGPYPFHEVATALLIAGIDRNAHPREEKELPIHHPLMDARYSARLFLMAFDKAKSCRQPNVE